MVKALLTITLLFFLLPAAFAVPTIQHTKILLTPFYYVSDVPANINLSANFKIGTPDGIYSTIFAKVEHDVFMQPNTTVFLWVNNQTCINPSFAVGNYPAGQYHVSFDCSNIIKTAGTYQFKEFYTKPVQGLTSYVTMDYINHPASEVKVHGTEYTRNVDANGKIFTQLISGNSTINDATCTVKAYYPDNNVFINDSIMSFLEDGIYYHDFNIASSQMLGVYPTSISCLSPANATEYNPLSFNITYGTNPLGVIGDVNETDGNSIRFQETNLGGGGINRTLNVTFNFSGINLKNTTHSIVMHSFSQWFGSPNENLSFYVYNFSSGSFFKLPNEIYDPTPAAFVDVQNTIPAPFSQWIVNGTMQIAVVDTHWTADAANSNFDIDHLGLHVIDNLSIPVENLKGAGELHITEDIFGGNINSTVTQIYGQTTQINQTVFDIQSLLLVINSTLTSMNSVLGQLYNLSLQINQTVSAINFTPVINIFPTFNISSNPVFNVSSNITINSSVNLTAYVNTTQFIEELLETDVVEFPLTSGLMTYGSNFQKLEGYTVNVPYRLGYYPVSAFP